MGEASGQLLPFAVGVAVSPMPIVAVVLMLVDDRSGRCEMSGKAAVTADNFPRAETDMYFARWYYRTSVWEGRGDTPTNG